MRELQGRKALVTGAASGIGRAIALALARQGVDLWLLDVDVAGLEKVVGETKGHGIEAVGRCCDLTEPAAISAAIGDLLAAWNGVDILVNNAGVAYYGPTEKMTAEQWQWLMGINLLAPIQITRELLPSLLSRGEAHILNVCSISGLVAGGRFAAYHVSKFGLIGFSEALRAEYGRRGVGVTALCPGPVRTNLYRKAASGRTDRRVPEPPAWLCASEEQVAARAIRAIRRNRRMVLITPMAHLLYNVKRFAPWFLDALNHIGRKKRKPVEGIQRAAAASPESTNRAA